jgi:glycolate oxidase FAD binding subunit
MAATVFEPDDAASAAALLGQAAVERRRIGLTGAGTKLAWTTPSAGAPPIDVALSTRRMTAPLEHFAGDLVATLPAGVTLAEANATLAREHQWLPLDPPRGDRATIGGIVAANDSGPRRHLHGATRDLIIGVEVALADGRVAKAGGRVVKNVAGYDLSRLLCGSFGSLGVITRATFKLAPLPPASRTLVATFAGVRAAHAAALAVASAPVSPSAVEIALPGRQLLIRFETTEQAAERQTEIVRALVEGAGGHARVMAADDERLVWRAHEASVWEKAGTIVKVSVLPTQVAHVCALVDEMAARRIDAAAIGRAALGVVYVRIDGAIEAQVDAVTALRLLSPSTVVLEAVEPVRARVSAWPDMGDAFPLMRAVKSRFDPHHILNPGRGPGGL